MAWQEQKPGERFIGTLFKMRFHMSAFPMVVMMVDGEDGEDDDDDPLQEQRSHIFHTKPRATRNRQKARFHDTLPPAETAGPAEPEAAEVADDGSSCVAAAAGLGVSAAIGWIPIVVIVGLADEVALL